MGRFFWPLKLTDAAELTWWHLDNKNTDCSSFHNNPHNKDISHTIFYSIIITKGAVMRAGALRWGHCYLKTAENNEGLGDTHHRRNSNFWPAESVG